MTGRRFDVADDVRDAQARVQSAVDNGFRVTVWATATQVIVTTATQRPGKPLPEGAQLVGVYEKSPRLMDLAADVAATREALA